jgi:UDP-N-acetylmuramyl pentapeptide phosphotransferase/UDP-N-acetylglucosamine-1-phosphate transferase
MPNVEHRDMFPSFDSIESAIWPGVALCVFVVSASVVDLMIILAARLRLVDLPNRRSSHALPTARGGGVSIVLLVAAAATVVTWRWPSLARSTLIGVILPSLVIAAVGLYDDIKPIRPVIRLAIQLGVAAFMTAMLHPLTSVRLPSGGSFELGWMGWPITIIWIVGLINAYNFMDGADGMAALGAVMVGASVAAIGFESHEQGVMLIASFTAAATAGFLVFNWQPARVFMGDVGSGFLGCIFAGLPLLLNVEERPVLFLPTVLCLWPYIYDPLLSVLRRLWHGHNPLKPHREFLFHRLVRSGVSHSTASLIYGLLSAIGGVLGLAMLNPDFSESARTWIPALVVALAASLTLGVELRCARVGLAPASGRGSQVSNSCGASE